MKECFVIRHGSTEFNQAGRVQGTLDIPLSRKGRIQASLSATSLVDMGITEIVSSPLSRARETADIIAAKLGLAVREEPRFRARELGEWAGRPRKEIKQLWNDVTHPFRNDPHFAPPGGESLHQTDERLFQAFQEIKQQSQGTPLLVMHLIGCGALLLEMTGQRTSFGNAEVWKLILSEKRATFHYAPTEESVQDFE